MFRKKERKKSVDDGSSTIISSTIDDGQQSLEGISHYQERFRMENSVYINLHGDDHVALPSESVSIPVETPTELLDKFEASRVLIQTQAKIEIEPRSSQQTMIQPLSSSQSRQSISSEKSQHKGATNVDPVTNGAVQCSVSQSSSKESVSKKKPDVISKPKRRSKEKQLSKQSDSSFEDNVPPPPRPPRSRASSSADQQPTKPQATQKTTTTSVTPDVDHNSSESERDLEIDFLKNKHSKTGDETLESKGLFYEESFEEDLPYVPTTLPLEKSAAVPIVPVKERLQDIK